MRSRAHFADPDYLPLVLVLVLPPVLVLVLVLPYTAEVMRPLLLLLAALTSLGACTCGRSSPLPEKPGGAIPSAMASTTTFGPTVAGGFYPADPKTLDDMVNQALKEGAPAHDAVGQGRRVIGIMSPHAGYVYSGPVAGWAFGALKGEQVRTVVVLGPSHHARTDQACTLDVDAYRTPIGDVPIATEVVKALLAEGKGLLRVEPRVFQPEHSVDVQIPFVVRALPGAKVVPIIVPFTPDERFFDDLASLLYKVIGKDETAVLVASSDLSHFFAYDTAKKLDHDILQSIEKLEIDSLIAHHDERGGPCGVAPLTVVLKYLQRFGAGARASQLRYQNSGDTRGDKRRVVGYGAVAFSVPKTSN